jgi:signal transduction histidine kinase
MVAANEPLSGSAQGGAGLQEPLIGVADLHEEEQEEAVPASVQTDPFSMNRWLAFVNPAHEAAFVATQRSAFVRNYRFMVVSGVFLNLIYVGVWGFSCFDHYGTMNKAFCLSSHGERVTGVATNALFLLTVPLARQTVLSSWIVPNLMIITLGINMRQAVYFAAMETKASWPGPDSPLYNADVTRFAMIGSENTTFLFWQALYMGFLSFLLSVPFSFRQTTQLSLTALASFLLIYFDIANSPSIPDWDPSWQFTRFPAVLPLFALSFCTIGVMHSNETTKRQGFVEQLKNRLLETKISQLALETERTLRHEAEYRLQFEKKLTAFVCSELQTPFTTMKSATRFVVSALQQTRQSSTPPLDWSSRLGSILEWCVPITESSTYISDFLGNVLDLSRIEQGTLALSDEPVYLAPIAERVKERIHGTLLERQVQFTVDIDPTLCVTGDAARIEQVLTILAEKALERTTFGFVRLAARVIRQDTTETGAQQLVLEVADTGTGISTDQVPFLFVRRTPGMQIARPRLSAPSSTRALCDQLSMAVLPTATADGTLQTSQQQLWQTSAAAADPAHALLHAQQTNSGLGLVLAHQIVRLWGSAAGLQVCSPAWTQEQRARASEHAVPAAAADRLRSRRLNMHTWGPGSIFSFQVPIAVLCRQPTSESQSGLGPMPQATSSSVPVSEPAPLPCLESHSGSGSSSTSGLSSPFPTGAEDTHTHNARGDLGHFGESEV